MRKDLTCISSEKMHVNSDEFDIMAKKSRGLPWLSAEFFCIFLKI